MTTKKALVEEYRNNISTDPKWTVRALLKLYELQTPNEQKYGLTGIRNHVGFSAYDAPFLSVLAEKVNNDKKRTGKISLRCLSAGERRYIREHLPKYSSQLVKQSRL